MNDEELIKNNFTMCSYYKYIGKDKNAFNKARDKFGVLIAYTVDLYDNSEYNMNVSTYYDPYKRKEVEKINESKEISLLFYYYSNKLDSLRELSYLKEHKFVSLKFFKKNFTPIDILNMKSIVRIMKIKKILD